MKKVLSVILSLCMILSLMPLTAYAVEADTTPPVMLMYGKEASNRKQ